MRFSSFELPASNLFLLVLATMSSATPLHSGRRWNVLRRENDEHRRWVANGLSSLPQRPRGIDRRQDLSTGATARIDATSLQPIPLLADSTSATSSTVTAEEMSQSQPKVATAYSETTIMSTMSMTVQVTVPFALAGTGKGSFDTFPASRPLQTTATSSSTSAEIATADTGSLASSAASSTVTPPTSITVILVTASPTFTGPIGGYTTLMPSGLTTVLQNKNATTSRIVQTGVSQGLSSIPLSSSTAETTEAVSESTAESSSTAQSLFTTTGITQGLGTLTASVSDVTTSQATEAVSAPTSFTVSDATGIVPGLSSIRLNTTTAQASETQATQPETASTFTATEPVSNGLSSIPASPFPPLPSSETTASSISAESTTTIMETTSLSPSSESASAPPSTNETSQPTETIVVPPSTDTTISVPADPPASSQTSAAGSVTTITGSTAPPTIEANSGTALPQSTLSDITLSASSSITERNSVVPITSRMTTAVAPVSSGSGGDNDTIATGIRPTDTLNSSSSSIFVSTLSVGSSSTRTESETARSTPTRFVASTIVSSTTRSTSISEEIVTPSSSTAATTGRKFHGDRHGDDDGDRQDQEQNEGTKTITSTATTVTVMVDSSGNVMTTFPTTTAAVTATESEKPRTSQQRSEGDDDEAGNTVKLTDIEAFSSTSATAVPVLEPETRTLVQNVTITETERVNVPIIETVTATETTWIVSSLPAVTVTTTEIQTSVQTSVVGATTVTASVVLTAARR